ncbi:hypothetical protein C4565_04200 [Candidatus Parcubacteria bacterium]|jgi:hypothetical protein|nr:MAG: hypothetical protein C4565_04200 [Candidatus Parcubacteria bacterium]
MNVEDATKTVEAFIALISKTLKPFPTQRRFVQVYDKEEQRVVISMVLGSGNKKNGLDTKQRMLAWLLEHPDAVASAESCGDAPDGGISGRRYIVLVSGGFPIDNSALAILLFAQIEHEPVDTINRETYIEKAGCKEELNSLLNFLEITI